MCVEYQQFLSTFVISREVFLWLSSTTCLPFTLYPFVYRLQRIQALIQPPQSEESGKRVKKVDKEARKQGRSVNNDNCDSCGEGGDLLCCDRCPCAFHLTCWQVDYTVKQKRDKNGVQQFASISKIKLSFHILTLTNYMSRAASTQKAQFFISPFAPARIDSLC